MGSEMCIRDSFRNMDDCELADRWLRKGVAVIPGSAFGSQGAGCIRLSYGSADMRALSEAFDRIKEGN